MMPADETPLAYVAELKIDGLSIALTYERGRLVARATRGDGVHGEDVTSNIRVVRAVPWCCASAPPEALEIRRGVSAAAAFAKMNDGTRDAGEPPFANPRERGGPGAIRTLDPRARRATRTSRVCVSGRGAARTPARRHRTPRCWASSPAGAVRSRSTGSAARAWTRSSRYCEQWRDARHALPFEPTASW
jgi:DNA ligase (NAD+)